MTSTLIKCEPRFARFGTVPVSTLSEDAQAEAIRAFRDPVLPGGIAVAAALNISATVTPNLRSNATHVPTPSWG